MAQLTHQLGAKLDPIQEHQLEDLLGDQLLVLLLTFYIFKFMNFKFVF